MIETWHDFFITAWNIFIENWPLFWYGVKITLLLAICGTLFGLLIGLIAGGLRGVHVEPTDGLLVKMGKRVLHGSIGFYVWIFRGTPMMVQAMFLYYGLKQYVGWDALSAGIVIISVNTGAYMSEIIRSGIQSVEKGQKEAARSLGMSSVQTMMCIILPQAIKNAFPSIGNQLIVNIKDSSMLNVISVVELYFQSSSVAGSTMQYAEAFISTCVLYLVLTTLATCAMNFIEKKLTNTKTSLPKAV